MKNTDLPAGYAAMALATDRERPGVVYLIKYSNGKHTIVGVYKKAKEPKKESAAKKRAKSRSIWSI